MSFVESFLRRYGDRVCNLSTEDLLQAFYTYLSFSNSFGIEEYLKKKGV